MVNCIRTERLEIKPLSGTCAEDLVRLLVREEIKKTYMLPDFPDRQALDQMGKRLTALSCTQDRFVRGIYLKGRLIGFVNDVATENGSIELGYVIHPDHWGCGYATEMLRSVIPALLSHGFSAIRAGAFCGNTASIRVMEKCGMVKCPQEETIHYRGENHACVYYEIRA